MPRSDKTEESQPWRPDLAVEKEDWTFAYEVFSDDDFTTVSTVTMLALAHAVGRQSGHRIKGWNCPACRVFNGEEKERRSECRSCGEKRP